MIESKMVIFTSEAGEEQTVAGSLGSRQLEVVWLDLKSSHSAGKDRLLSALHFLELQRFPRFRCSRMDRITLWQQDTQIT